MSGNDEYHDEFGSMEPQATLRDQFAMSVLPAIVSYNIRLADGWNTIDTARLAYDVADAMLAERNRK